MLTRSSLPGNSEDRQARYIEAAVNGVLITSIYLPNGNPLPGPKFDYKLAWFERLIQHGAELMKAGVPVVLAGDYNVVPTVQDIYPTRSLDNNALIQPQSRQAYARLLVSCPGHNIIAFDPSLGCETVSKVAASNRRPASGVG